jgi:glutathione synthase/RimK-type ligase-like ATP-grasp enzyme
VKFAVVAHRHSATNDALVAAAAAWGLEAAVVDPRRALALLEPGDIALARLDVREQLDGIERGTGELERLAAGGVDVRNPPGALIVAHDKLLTARTLRLAGLPHPHTTHISPALPAAVPELPLVLKPRFGSWGRDVELCSTADELDLALVRLQGKRWFREHGALAQELVEPQGSWLEAPAAEPPVPGRKTAAAVNGRSWDLRLVVAGGRVVGAARRVAHRGEWRTNAALGADVVPADPPPIAKALALAAAEAARVDLAGIDLLPTRNGFVVLEINGAVDFRPLYLDSGDVFAETVAALLGDATRQRELAAASA